MQVEVHAGACAGVIRAPASKSYTQRALAAALIREGRTIITGAGNSSDEFAAISIIKTLGAAVLIDTGKLIVESKGFPPGEFPKKLTLNCGESALAARLFSPLAALASAEIEVTGTGSLSDRDMSGFTEIFTALETPFHFTNHTLPLNIEGPLRPREISLSGKSGSQYLTGLLFAYAAVGCTETIFVDALVSKSYIDMTIDLLLTFGYTVDNKQYRSFQVYKTKEVLADAEYSIEGDWSNCAFFLVAAAISGEIEIRGLDTSSVQGDRIILEVLVNCGAHVTANKNGITIAKNELRAFDFDATEQPDLFPPLVALAANCKGRSVIRGTNRLSGKESDRAQALRDVYSKMGIAVHLQGNDMVIEGGIIRDATVESHNDHRIAMSAAIAAFGGHTVTINSAEAVNKSCPEFFELLGNLGASIKKN